MSMVFYIAYMCFKYIYIILMVIYIYICPPMIYIYLYMYIHMSMCTYVCMCVFSHDIYVDRPSDSQCVLILVFQRSLPLAATYN